MAHDFKVGDHVECNSEDHLQGVYGPRPKEEPQYLIKSDKTDHMAMHKGSAFSLTNRRSNILNWIFWTWQNGI